MFVVLSKSLPLQISGVLIGTLISLVPLVDCSSSVNNPDFNMTEVSFTACLWSCDVCKQLQGNLVLFTHIH